MARYRSGRSDPVDRILLQTPWWMLLVLAPIAYFAIAYVLPGAAGKSALTSMLRGFYEVIGLGAAFVLVLAAIAQAFRQIGARRLLDRQTGIASIRAMHWRDLENLMGEAYRRQGYRVEPTGRRGPDGGIDLIIEKDGKWLVQCKQWKAFSVGVKEVRELFGLVAADPADGGILVTCGKFTAEARAFTAGKPIELIDGERLVELVQSVQSPGTPGGRQHSDVATATRVCPSCGRPMVVRTAKRGANVGNRFLGCTGYPKCRETASLPD